MNGSELSPFLQTSSTKAKDTFFPVPTKLKPGGLHLNSFWESGINNSNKIISDAAEEQEGEPKSPNS